MDDRGLLARALDERLDHVRRRRHVRVAAAEVDERLASARGGLLHAREQPHEVLLGEPVEPAWPLHSGSSIRPTEWGGSLRPDSARPGRCDRSVNVPCVRTLTLRGDNDRSTPRRKLRNFLESRALQSRAQALRRHVDRRLGTGRVGDEHVPARSGDAPELPEERDHVAERDEVEGAVRERQLLGVGDLEPDAGRVASRRASSIIRSDTSTASISASGRRAATSRATAPVPVPTSSARAGGDVRLSRAASTGASMSGLRSPSHLGASLSNCERSGRRKSRHSSGPVDHQVGDDACEALAGGQGCSGCRRMCWPGCRANISAALPRLIAIEMLRYESSYRTISPGRASANVRAAVA